MDRVLALGIGSLVGGFARWIIGESVMQRIGQPSLPYGTLAVNLIGCLLIGLLYGASDGPWPLSARGRMLLMTGFCGAFTTFSALVLETSMMIDKGNSRGALAYVLASVLLGLFVFRGGAAVARVAAANARLEARSEAD